MVKHRTDRIGEPASVKGVPRASSYRFLVGMATLALILFPGLESLRGEASGGGAGVPSAVGVAQREAERRQQQIRQAQDLLTDAELDRREGSYGEAFEKYRTAYLATPNVPAARNLRESIFKRYQQVAIQYTNELIEEAEWEKAEEVLETVMKDARDTGVAPGNLNPEIRTLLARLRGDFYNKAVTPQHLANVDAVSNTLMTANSFVEIGDFAKARQHYHVVLNIDPTNKAARIGLETVERMVMEYQEVARDSNRARMLRQVSEGWESPVPPSVIAEGIQTETTIEVADSRKASLQAKLKTLVYPSVEFANTPLQDVIEYLGQVAQELDVTEPDPAQRGVNIVVDPQSASGSASVMSKPVTLRLSNAPLEAILQYVTQQVGMKYRLDPFAITIVPLSAADDTRLLTRTYEVPPGFISGQDDGGAAGGPVDPFANPAPAAGAGALVKRVSPQEFLESRGVTFPAGSLASFNSLNSTLLVKNTPDNISLVEALVLGAKQGGEKQISIEFKILEVAQEVVNELGFDWLLGGFNVGNSGVFMGGGTEGFTQGSRQSSDFPFRFPGTDTPVGQNPLTAGLRSGPDPLVRSIEDAIASDSVSSGTTSTAAPGVFALSGPFTDPQFQMVLRALNQSKGTDLLSTASVVTKPGQRAVIRQVREFIYPTEYDPPEIPTNFGGGQGGTTFVTAFPVTPATPAAFETRELGTVLEVEPIIGGDGYTVDLNLTIDSSEFEGFINYGSPILTANLSPVAGTLAPLAVPLTENEILMPVFEAIKETTNSTIYDGQTIAIGGLLGEEIVKVEDKIPVLGDTPVAGRLFRSTRTERQKRALILFATVRILDPAGSVVNE